MKMDVAIPILGKKGRVELHFFQIESTDGINFSAMFKWPGKHGKTPEWCLVFPQGVGQTPPRVVPIDVGGIEIGPGYNFHLSLDIYKLLGVSM